MVTALVVTYGDRWDLLKQLLEHLVDSTSVSEIILVDNASSHVLQTTSYMSSAQKRFNHIVSEVNLGSAGAYKKGLEHFVSHSTNNLVWLLDDDNMPAQNALQILLDNASRRTNEKFTAYLSLRTDRPYLVSAANGKPLRKLFPTADSYLGFNLFKSSTNPFGLTATTSCANCMFVPMAPYGGLLLTKEMVESIGLPLEDYFLYGDDFEYTYRITKSGGCICLVKDSIVNDIDASWVSTRKKFLKPRLLFQDDFRSNYAIRNAVYFSARILKRRSFVFWLNNFFVNVYYLATAFIHLKPFLFVKYLKLANQGKRFTPQK